MKGSNLVLMKTTNLNFNRSFTTHLDHDDDYADDRTQTMSTCDYIKMVIIIVLLTASVIMYKYEPITPIKDTPILVRALSNQSNQTEVEEVEDNPYGFHPFYQVHKRVQYKNPVINPCNDIDPKRTILLALLSRASNAHIREAIRHSWGAVRSYNDIEVRITFIVGVDDGMIKQIEMEQNVYHGNFSYKIKEKTLLFLFFCY